MIRVLFHIKLRLSNDYFKIFPIFLFSASWRNCLALTLKGASSFETTKPWLVTTHCYFPEIPRQCDCDNQKSHWLRTSRILQCKSVDIYTNTTTELRTKLICRKRNDQYFSGKYIHINTWAVSALFASSYKGCLLRVKCVDKN
jgi:hypothetical protein